MANLLQHALTIQNDFPVSAGIARGIVDELQKPSLRLPAFPPEIQKLDSGPVFFPQPVQAGLSGKLGKIATLQRNIPHTDPLAMRVFRQALIQNGLQ